MNLCHLNRLLLLRDNQLEHFAKISGARTALSHQELLWLRTFLSKLDSWLEEGNDQELRRTMAQLAGELPISTEQDILCTTHLDDNALAAALAAGSTPFTPGPAAPPPSRLSNSPHEDIGATTTVSDDEIAAIIGQLPAAATPPMAIRDYAQLVAQTEPGASYATPKGRQQCHLHHNISDESHRTAIDHTFHRIFQSNQKAWSEYTHALAEWRQWLKTAAKQ